MVDNSKVLELSKLFRGLIFVYQENFKRVGHHAPCTLLLHDFVYFSLYYLAVNNEWTDEKMDCVKKIFNQNELLIEECKNGIISNIRSFSNYFLVSFKNIVNVDNLLGEYFHTFYYCELVMKLINFYNDSFDDVEIEKSQRGIELINDLKLFASESLIKSEDFNCRSQLWKIMN